MEEDIKKPNQESELEVAKKQAEEYLNNWKRERADFLNYKKDEVERASLLAGYARQGMLYSILPVLDSIDLATKSMPEAFQKDSWSMGFMQITNQIKDFLKKEGIEEIETVGQKFDPNFMEAVGEAEGGDAGTIAEELQKGYKVGGKVFRPAKVKVTK
ncbi:nucleotide exchange factor GrpE [Candidatus Parcubacteria bacterium]|nr:nucleotide exchange factor GrpE [Candidatus Parcubacteria bacterium]